MKSFTDNIYTGIPDQLPEELVECIFKRHGIEFERIVSRGHVTPAEQWYDQDWDEWVLLLQGQAILLYENGMHSIPMAAGDYLLIPARTRHRVEWTPPDIDTIWLAVHLR